MRPVAIIVCGMLSAPWLDAQVPAPAPAQPSNIREQDSAAIRVETVRFITADVAIADGPYEIVAEGADAAATRRMWTSFVLVQQSAGWRIAAIRNMRPTAAAPPR